MKNRIFYIIILITSIFQNCYAQEVLTLEELILKAQRNNFSLKEITIDSLQNKEAFRYNKFNYLPSISGGLKNTYNWGLFIDPATNVLSNFSSQVYSFNVVADWVMFDGGKTYYNGQIYDLNKQAANQAFQNSVFEIRNSITTLYYKYWHTVSQLNLAKKNSKIWEHKENRIKKMVQAGTLPAKELLHISSYIELYKINIAKLENEVLLSYNQIQLSCFSKDSFILKAPDMNAVLEPISSNFPDFTKFPVYLSQNIKIEIENQKINLAKAARFPVAGISAGWVTRSSSLIQTELNTQFNTNLSKYVGFYVNIPLFNKMQPKFLITQSEFEKQKYNYKKDQILIEYSNKLNQIKEQYIITEKSISIVKKQIEYLEKEVEMTEKAFELGTTTYFELETIQERLEKASISLISYQYENLLYKRLYNNYSNFIN